MKNILSVLFIVLIQLQLFGSDYTWSVDASKEKAYVNEAIYLKYICEFSDKAELYTIEFSPVGEYDDYSIELLSESIRIIDGKKISSYEFVAFVKKEMDIEFSFEALMKKTTRASIENTVLGRDNINYEESVKTLVKLDSVHVNVSSMPTTVFGDFKLSVKKSESILKAYQPYHLDVTVSGIGDFKDISDLTYEIEGVKVFSQKAFKEVELTANGYKGRWNQKFAFVSGEDFVIPQKSIEYFDPELHKVRKLVIESQKITIQKSYDKTELLDEEESLELDFELVYMYYFLSFILGYFVAKIGIPFRKNIDSQEKKLRDKIENAESFDLLSMLLILENQQKYHTILAKIESRNISLKQAKKEAIYISMEKK